jgi:tetratricopeptide (TPR) repeat protein
MRRQTWQAGVVCLWVGALGITTWTRCHVWQSDRALWADAVLKAPAKPRAIMNYGRTRELAGDPVTAERLYREVIGICLTEDRRPAYVRRFSIAAAEVNIAHLYMKDGRMASAMRILDQTIAGWPEFPYAHYNKGAILWVYGACDEARSEYLRAQQYDISLPLPTTSCEQSSSTP